MKGSAYETLQYEQGYPPGIEHHFWNLARNRVILSKVRRYVSAQSRILEIGCGRGIVVDYLRTRGIDCRGCELARIDVPPGLRGVVCTGTDAFELEPGFRRGIGAILALDVLEHIPDPGAFLCRALDAFPGVTRLLVTLPARPELWSNFDEHYGHLRRYTLATARELARDLPLRVLECGHFFHALYPSMRVGRMLRFRREVVLAPPRVRGVHRLLSLAFAAEERLLPGGWAGTSIVVVFERVS